MLQRHPGISTNTRFPILPPGMQRSQVEALLVAIAPALRLSGARLRTLLFIIARTRPSDWTNPDVEPVCYMAQTELATALGKSERAVRSDEAILAGHLDLIEKRTAANGGRSRAGGLGLVLSRLIARIPEFIALRDRLADERQKRRALLRQLSACRRRLAAGLAQSPDGERGDDASRVIGQRLRQWPDTGYLRRLPLETLKTRHDMAEALCAELDVLLAGRSTSGPAVESFRSPIQETTEEESEARTGDETGPRPVRGSANRHIDALPAADPARPKRPPIPNHRQRKTRFLDALGPEQLLQLCGADMQMRVRIAQQGRPAPRPQDFITGALAALSVLRVHPSAWEEAVGAMGLFRAALCLIIADANRTRPSRPVRNPGGYLRALARNEAHCPANLAASLFGLLQRQEKQRAAAQVKRREAP